MSASGNAADPAIVPWHDHGWMEAPAREAPARHVPLATVSFAISFAAWGLVSAFAPRFRQGLGLSGTQTALLVAVPVLLGAVARLPVGMAADRFGARVVFKA